MKKIISFLLLAVLCVSSLQVSALDENGIPEYKEEEYIGRINWSAQTHGGAITYDRKGRPLLCYGTQGGFFYVIDLMTGQVKERFNSIGSYIMAHMVLTGPDGKVYMHFYPGYTINVYDPVTGAFYNEHPGVDIHSQDGGNIIGDTMYIGEYSSAGARVFEYNLTSKKMTTYGPLDPNCHYVKGAVGDENYVYAGMGTGVENTKIIRIDKKTREQVEFLHNTGGGIVYELKLCGDRLVAYTNGRLHVVDTNTLEKLTTIPGNTPSEPAPYDNAILYYSTGGNIYEFNTRTLEYKKVAESPLDGRENCVFTQWAELTNGDYVVTFRTFMMSQIGYYNPRTGEAKVVNVSEIAEAGPNVQSFDISEDGILYGGGYQTSQGAYNLNTGEYLYSMPKWHQNEGLGFLNGKTYFGVYTDSLIYRYDPEKPITQDYLNYNYDTVYRGYDANPSMIYDIEDGQDRPFAVKGWGNKVYVGTMSGYNQIGGALTIIEEEDGINPPKTEVYRNIIPAHSITGIAKRSSEDKFVYISSTARNGLGSADPEDMKAKIAVFDEEKKEVVDIFEPDLPGVGTSSKTIGEIAFGPDGLLWCANDKDGIVFAVDTETHEVVKSVTLNGGWDRGPLARPLYLRWGDDGLLYTTAGWIVSVINPETMEYKKLTPNCSLMALDHEGNVLYAKGGGVVRIPINQYDRLTLFLKTLDKLNKKDYTEDEWEILQETIEKAKTYTEDTDDDAIIKIIREIKGFRDKKPYIEPQNEMKIILDGEEMELSYDTTGITKVYKGRTLIPYRAFLEKLGYKVKWDVHTDTIKAEKEDSTIKFVMNSNIVEINGVETESDVPPVLLSGRHYIPLRFVAENLGYEVKWNEKESAVEITVK